MPPRTKVEVLTADQLFKEDLNLSSVDDPGPEAPEIALTTTLQQLGQDEAETARVIVYRMVEDKGRVSEEYLYETSPAEFAVEGIGGIAREHGGGTYRVRVFLKGGRGFLTQKVIKIARDIKPATAAPVASNAGIEQLAAAMMQGFQQLGTLIAQQAAQAPKTDNRADFLREMMLMKELFSSNAPAPTSPLGGMGEMMEIFKQGMEIGRMGGGEPSTTDVLMKGIEAFAPALQAVVQQQSQPHMPPVPRPAPVNGTPALPPIPSPAATQQSPQETDMNIMQRQMLKSSLAFLVTQARQNSDPYTYANMVLDNLPPDELNILMTDPAWLDRLAQFCPDVSAPDVSPWFGELKSAIGQLLAEEAAGELTNSAPGSINSPHATTETGQSETDGNPGAGA